MPEQTITIARARYETLIRQALSAGEAINALMAALKAEVDEAATDPRITKHGRRPSTFNTPPDA